ncbi:MAG: hypothetical protein H6729_06415 [Deltaproteobacteria bacterium]|nr:hypothetical protein [Deltaproteobacteria bacterium]
MKMGRVRSLVAFALLFTACTSPRKEASVEPGPDYATTATPLMTSNGFTFNSLGANGLAVNGLPLNGLYANGLPLNGLPLNGLPLNGMTLNGLPLNGVFLSGIQLNGLYANGLPLNGLPLNGIHVNGVYANGFIANGFPLNGLPLDGVPLDGVLINDVPLDDTTAVAFKNFLAAVARCALPSGTCMSATDLDGAPLSFCGEFGHDPDWLNAAPTLSKSAAVGQCLIEYPPTGFTAIMAPVLTDGYKKVIQYLVQCALPAGRSVTVYDEDGSPYVLEGAMGLAPEWENSVPTPVQRRLVSSCLAARTNANGQTVRISVRGGGMTTNGIEESIFTHVEGAFWADLFTDKPYIKSCTGPDGGGISGRLCTTPGGCGFEVMGSCADENICTGAPAADGSYTNCGDQPEVLTTFLPLRSSITFGEWHGCVIKNNKETWCWGNNTDGQVGDGTYKIRQNATYIDEMGTDAVEVVSMVETTLVRKMDGSLWVWGDNGTEPVRSGTGLPDNDLMDPVQVSDLGNDVVQTTAGGSYACVLKSDGTAWCWGVGERGQLGIGGEPGIMAARPVQVTALGNHVAYIAGAADGARTCALLLDGSVWCWGENWLGNGSSGMSMTPVQVSLSGPATDLAIGRNHTCVRLEDGSIWCWGDNTHGELGVGSDVPNSVSPMQVTGIDPATTRLRGLACTKYATHIVLADSTLLWWGNQGVSLAIGSWLPTTELIQPPGPVVAFFAGADRGCAKLTNGKLWCRGNNVFNALGVGRGQNSYLNELHEFTLVDPPATCDGGTCDATEYCSSCTSDCGVCGAGYQRSTCGDGVCNATENEDSITCPEDCRVAKTESSDWGDTSATGPATAVDTQYAGKIASSTDVDWFQYTLPPNKTLSLDLIVPSARNYDLMLYEGTTVRANSANAIALTSPSGLNYDLEAREATATREAVRSSRANGSGLREHIEYVNSTAESKNLAIKVFGPGGSYSTNVRYLLKVAEVPVRIEQCWQDATTFKISVSVLPGSPRPWGWTRVDETTEGPWAELSGSAWIPRSDGNRDVYDLTVNGSTTVQKSLYPGVASTEYKFKSAPTASSPDVVATNKVCTITF